MSNRALPLPLRQSRQTAPFASLDADLADLGRRDRLRRLIRQRGVDFSSNDYLGMAASPRLRQAVADAVARGVPIGSGGSRLLRGNHPEHEALEAEAAAWFGSETTLFFSTGYAANAALFATLPQKSDLIVHDDLIHASAHEGFRLSRATSVSARHNDPARIDDAIARWRSGGATGQAWIAVESLYSMDGDCAPIDELAAVAERHDAILVIDEAHATGVFGEGGRGLAAHLEGQPNVITLRTCGKALGCEGALVCAPRIVRDFLVNRARGFIFSTAPSPLTAAAVRASLRIAAEEPARRAQLAARVAETRRLLEPLGVAPSGSQIQPLIIGDDARTMAIADALQDRGFDIRGIRPPTVPQSTSRLRISLTLNASTEDVAALAATLEELL